MPEPEPETTHRLDLLGVSGVMLCCALWGGNAVAVKFAVPDVPPVGCAALRFVLALPLVAGVCRMAGQPLWAGRRGLWGLLIVHAMLAVVQIGTFNWGTSLSLASRAAVFINVHPLVVAPLSWLVLGERMGGRGMAGIASAAIGVAVLLSSAFEPGGSVAGDALVLISGVIFGCQTIAQKRTFPVIPPATLLFSQYVLAIPMFLAYSLAIEGASSYEFTTGAIWGLLFQGLAVSGVCFSTWFLLLRRYPANRITTLAFMTPLFGVGFGALFRGEPLRWELIAAGALVGLGIYLVTSDRAVHRERPAFVLPGEDAP